MKSQKSFEVAIQLIDKREHKKDIQAINDAFLNMNRLDHPNIAKYYEIYEDDTNMYLVMEFVDDQGNIQKIIDNPVEDDDDSD